MKFKNNLDFNIDSNILEILYQPQSEKVLYDICDYNGHIHHSGRIENRTTVCDIGKIPLGNYLIYIIDSGTIYKKRISIRPC